jgi:hypothetical protein
MNIPCAPKTIFDACRKWKARRMLDDLGGKESMLVVSDGDWSLTKLPEKISFTNTTAMLSRYLRKDFAHNRNALALMS